MDASRNIVARYTYNAWGEILSATGTMASINPLRYRGYYYDTETGFYYLQSRYYDPANHRFINADGYYSTETGFLGYNMFAYCNNNPVIYDDSSGNSLAVAASISAAVVAAVLSFTTFVVADAVARATADFIDAVGEATYDFVCGVAEAGAVVADGVASWISDVLTPDVVIGYKVCLSEKAIVAMSKAEAAPPDNNDKDKYKSENKTPRNNQAQNRQVDSIAKKYKMNKSQRRELHDSITGQGYGYWEIDAIARDIIGVP